MNKAYFHLIEKGQDIANMAVCIGKNANYKEAIDRQSAPHLESAIKTLEMARRLLYDILDKQMHYQ